MMTKEKANILKAIENVWGKEIAEQCQSYVQFANLPEVAAIIAQDVPARIDQRCIVIAILTTQTQFQDLEAVLRYALKLPAEHTLCLLQGLVKRPHMLKAIASSPSFKEWVQLSKEFLNKKFQ